MIGNRTEASASFLVERVWQFTLPHKDAGASTNPLAKSNNSARQRNFATGSEVYVNYPQFGGAGHDFRGIYKTSPSTFGDLRNRVSRHRRTFSRSRKCVRWHLYRQEG